MPFESTQKRTSFDTSKSQSASAYLGKTFLPSFPFLLPSPTTQEGSETGSVAEREKQPTVPKLPCSIAGFLLGAGLGWRGKKLQLQQAQSSVLT